MEIDEVARLDKRLQELTYNLKGTNNLGQARRFFCPILMVEEQAELCKGHVLPQSVDGMDWVVQRKDVDNFFGTFVQADFKHGAAIRELNSSTNTEEFLDYVHKHGVAKKIGLSVEIAKNIGAPASTFRDRNRVLGVRMDARVLPVNPSNATLIFSPDMMFATTVSCIHWVHLGLFRQNGYAYIDDKSGWFNGSMLGALYRTYGGQDRASERHKLKYDQTVLPKECLLHRNVVRPFLNSEESLDPKLIDSPFEWFHVAWDGETVFATIHYLKAKGMCCAVMVYTAFDERSYAHVCIDGCLSFTVSVAHFDGKLVNVDTRRTEVEWPCGANTSLPLPPVPLSRVAKQMRGRMSTLPPR